MKTMVLAFGLLGALAVNAQTITTNWIIAAPNFREVDGKLYNVEKSVRWQKIEAACLEQRGELLLCQEYLATEVSQAVRNRVDPLARIGGLTPNAGPIYDRRVVGIETNWMAPFLLKNCSAVPGELISIRAMEVGKTNIEHGTLKIFDYGESHKVAVVRTNRVAVK